MFTTSCALILKINVTERFLVAIDRRNGTEVAMETVKLAEEFMLSSGGLVVGIDLSGDPTVRDTFSKISISVKTFVSCFGSI